MDWYSRELGERGMGDINSNSEEPAEGIERSYLKTWKSAEQNRKQERGNEGTQHVGAGQGSDEATSPDLMEITTKLKESDNKENKQGPITIREAILAWRDKNQGRVKDKFTEVEQCNKPNDVIKDMILFQGKHEVEKEKQVIKEVGAGQYFVELAEKDDEEKGEGSKEWEKELALEIKQKLNIKRCREETDILLIKSKEDEEDGEKLETEIIKKKIKLGESTSGSSMALLGWQTEVSNEDDMAEEAGQYMPPQEP
ncbi:hypothetical protein PIB30_002583 [Stylosanthes scabra]|uniref:Uncharacterized protein n=1 Tax=Stylosanthes scabra TaxID=79078 RepID=A0ABU6Z111_9FABA|nr:hypothetical protein [Stylosanthes scabra]